MKNSAKHKIQFDSSTTVQLKKKKEFETTQTNKGNKNMKKKTTYKMC